MAKAHETRPEADTAQTIRERWDAVMRRRLPDLETMIEKDSVWSGGLALGYAVDLLSYQFGMPLAMQYARQAVASSTESLPGEAYEKLLADKANLDRETRVNINAHKVPHVRDLAYARAIVDGGALDAQRLREAVDAFEDTFAFVAPRSWHVTNQWRLHAAALAALVAGDHARASTLLASKRSFKDTQIFHSALKRLADGITKHGGRLPADGAEAQDFQRLFDIFRQPEPGASTGPPGDLGVNDDEIKRLELALIKERYITGNTDAPDWRRVFESICPPR